ncbi:aldehyde dehydrogenase [Paenibacillus dendritiformis C454]|uniref:Aldehyde dehydrogenase n=2 Tax=Paenibacillus dendritiformis TaxID=130049 RepID=H3SPI1_9BACL|nr:aldehyde dehydrogenase [Paenibacillus dendritiformis C454]
MFMERGIMMSQVKTYGLFINGEWRVTEQTAPLFAPYDGALLARISQAGEAELEEAVAGAQRAAAKMKAMPAHARADILLKAVEQMTARKEELARQLAQEAGKPIRAARAEMERTITTYRFAAEEAKRLYGETIPMDAAPGGEGRFGFTLREPLGVVAAITPFNFPANLVAHKLGPALAAGNAVVLKPASQTPLSALAMGDIFRQAGLPDGALQIVTGSGRAIGDQFVTDERVRKITFTGSEEVGARLKAKAGLRKTTLELGSNSALIVEPGVPLEPIIPRCVEGAFGYAGQVCISIQRIYVHESICQEFTERFVARTQQLQAGNPLDEATDISAMISEREAERIEGWVNAAVAQGAEIACGGRREGGYFMPTVLLGVKPDMDVSCRETFAPVVSIVPYASLDEAIALANRSDFGLNAGMYTANLADAMRAAQQLEAGGVIINDIPTFRTDHMPYGGVKNSGYGREGVKYAIQDMTELKFVCVNTWPSA